MKKKSVVAFDFDGTLTSSIDMEDRSMAYGCESVGIHGMNREILHCHYGPTEYGILKELVPPGDLKNAWEAFLSYYRKASKDLLPYEGIKELLKTLSEKKCLLLLVTGRSKETLDISLPDLGLDSYFAKCYVGSESGTNKEQSMEKIFHDYGIGKDDILYIGDTLDDIRMMKAIDVDILSVSYSHDLKYQEELIKANPGNVCTTVSELTKRILDSIQ